MAESAILTAVKLALRVSVTTFDNELTDIISACKLDLELCGITQIDDTDALIKRAIVVYCKANFGNNPDSEKYQKSFDMLKCSLSLAGDYIV